MKVWIRVLGFVVLAGLAFAFAAANGGQVVRVELGIATLRNVSLPVVVFGSVLLGMVVVFLAGLRADLRTRKVLRRYRRELERSGAVVEETTREEEA